MPIKRFNCQGSSGYMAESECGEYVTAGEYVSLALLLRQYLNAYPAFRSKPVGSPGSSARAQQEEATRLEDLAVKKLDGWTSGL